MITSPLSSTAVISSITMKRWNRPKHVEKNSNQLGRCLENTYVCTEIESYPVKCCRTQYVLHEVECCCRRARALTMIIRRPRRREGTRGCRRRHSWCNWMAARGRSDNVVYRLQLWMTSSATGVLNYINVITPLPLSCGNFDHWTTPFVSRTDCPLGRSLDRPTDDFNSPANCMSSME